MLTYADVCSAARFKAQQIPGYTNGGHTSGATNGALGGGSLASNAAQSEGEARVGHKGKAAACKEVPPHLFFFYVFTKVSDFDILVPDTRAFADAGY
jgi:hypothetical protein